VNYLIKEDAEYCMQSDNSKRQQPSKWLSGVEYHALITKMTDHLASGDLIDAPMPIFDSGHHPQEIYFKPVDAMYCLLASSPRNVNFPKLASGLKKQIIWKKQNFVTSLPKSHPLISYVVATAADRQRPELVYKMHICWRCEDEAQGKDLANIIVLCQVRCFKLSQQERPDFEKENLPPTLPAPGRELDEYLIKLGEEINKKKKEESFHAQTEHQESLAHPIHRKFCLRRIQI
jgi:hypothetical protein